MSTEDRAEWNYLFSERLGVLCGSGPTNEGALVIARAQADRALRVEGRIKGKRASLSEQFELEMARR